MRGPDGSYGYPYIVPTLSVVNEGKKGGGNILIAFLKRDGMCVYSFVDARVGNDAVLPPHSWLHQIT